MNFANAGSYGDKMWTVIKVDCNCYDIFLVIRVGSRIIKSLLKWSRGLNIVIIFPEDILLKLKLMTA